MTNSQIKRKIEKATGEKVHYYTRHDGDDWYEGEAGVGDRCSEVTLWDYCHSKMSANNAILLKLAKHHNVNIGETK